MTDTSEQLRKSRRKFLYLVGAGTVAGAAALYGLSRGFPLGSLLGGGKEKLLFRETLSNGNWEKEYKFNSEKDTIFEFDVTSYSPANPMPESYFNYFNVDFYDPHGVTRFHDGRFWAAGFPLPTLHDIQQVSFRSDFPEEGVYKVVVNARLNGTVEYEGTLTRS